MRIKRIEADSVADAMRDLRRELGEQALILHTKYLQPKGVTGWFRSPKVEILGAVDEPGMVAARAAVAGSDSVPTSAFARIQAQAQAAAAQALMPPAPAMAPAPPAPAPEREPAARAAKKGKKNGRSTPAEPATAAGLTAVAERPAERAGDRVVPVADVLSGIAFASTDWDRAPRRARRIAFVGPTGSGKTTTLAKLAARAQLEHGRRIGLVTIDTYRIGAVPQLAAYAEILKVPLEVAHTPEDLSQALIRLNDRDVVFIDTIGRSPLGNGIDGLVPFLAIAGADEIHLVLSATTRPSDSIRAARSFARLVPNRLVITKTDETDDYSGLAMVAQMTSLPLTWLGVGQEVPDDIQEATPPRIAALLAAGSVA